MLMLHAQGSAFMVRYPGFGALQVNVFFLGKRVDTYRFVLVVCFCLLDSVSTVSRCCVYTIPYYCMELGFKSNLLTEGWSSLYVCSVTINTT